MESKYAVKETLDRLQKILQDKGVTIYARIDQQAEARKVGLDLSPVELLIFGNPKAGTPLMAASPTIAIDLPLKILVWEDDAGHVQISYNSPAYLQARHGLPRELAQNIGVVEALAAVASE